MEKLRRFLAYYTPHMGLFLLDMVCALIAAVADLAQDRDAVVCFESTGGQEWQLWALL